VERVRELVEGIAGGVQVAAYVDGELILDVASRVPNDAPIFSWSTDWDGMCARLADATPLWEPGTRHGYHAWTFGWLVGETVRRATGRTVSSLLASEVAGPLGVAGELFFGVPAADRSRVAPLVDDGYDTSSRRSARSCRASTRWRLAVCG
jgi:CubicO group peptidase (beta-lactamase class C family)